MLRWVGLAVCLAALAWAFVNLGFWQLDRLDQRRERNGAVVAHENSPVVDWQQVFTRPITEADQWQRVRASGTYDAAHQFVVRYRSNAGQTGYEIVTPLRTQFGTVLVDRGFIVRPPAQDFPRIAPAPPTGTVTVVGYVRRDEQGDADAITPAEGQVRLINSGALGATLPYPVANGFLSVLTSEPAPSDGLVPVSPPELNEGNHFSYALQWFSFAVLAAIGLVVFIRADLRDRAKTRERRARAAASPEDP